jgi:hypothetical protein
MNLEFKLEESNEAPAHFKECEIKPGDCLHRTIAENLFYQNYLDSKDKRGTFSEWYQQNLADKPLTERLEIEGHSYKLNPSSEVTEKDVLDSDKFKELVLKAQQRAKETKSVILYELKIEGWPNSYGVVLANGLETTDKTEDKDVPIWLNVGMDDKHYSFVKANKDDKSEIFYVHTFERSDAQVLEYDN